MKRSLFILLLLLGVLLLPSCRRTAEKFRRDVRIEAVEHMELYGMGGFDLGLRVKNDTRHRLVLRNASCTLWYGDASVVEVLLRQPAEAAPRTTECVVTRWKLNIEDPFAFLMLARRVGQDDLSNIFISYRAEGRGGPVPVKISQPRMPLSEFLRTFGLKTQELKHYLNL